MTTYFVTGATGFLGRRVVERLLRRPDQPTVFALVRPGSTSRLAGFSRPDAVHPVPGDLTEPGLGIAAADRPGELDHVIHLGALYDLTAPAEAAEAVNVGGTRHVLDFTRGYPGAVLHHVSSIAVAGDHTGAFGEDDLDVGQGLPSAYHRTKFEAELLVRAQTGVPWRVYRPAVVVGDSRTGEMDKIDGPYYFLPAIARLAALPAALPLPGPDLGATNVVPVDYVAAALAHLVPSDEPVGRTFHLVAPRSQPLTEVYNAFAAAAGAPRVRVGVPGGAATSAALLRVAGTPVGAAVSGELGIPPEVLPHLALTADFGSARTRLALEGTGIEAPPLARYADRLWRYWRSHLDPDRAARIDRKRPLAGRTVLITGASSGIGRATALAVARRGGIPLLVARRPEELASLRDEIVAAGGTAHCHPCDLTDGDAVDALVEAVIARHGAVDMLVNNAGRSIRRSVALSADRLHDFERTLALNYLAPLRLVLGLLPHMRERRFGHVVNVTTMGLQTDTPRFAAYLGSKAALDEFGRVAGRELLADGVGFTSVRMPLVRTPMISPTSAYRALPAASPEAAAALVVRALERRPVSVNRPEGVLAELAATVAPGPARLIAHLVYAVMPESAPEADRRSPAVTAAAGLARLVRHVTTR